MASDRSFQRRQLIAEVRRQVGRTPLTVGLGARENSRGWHIEPGSRDPAESVLHAGLERPLHLATTLLAKQEVVCFVGRVRA